MTNPLPVTGGMAWFLHPHPAVLTVNPVTGAIRRVPFRWSDRRDWWFLHDAGHVAKVDHVTYERHAVPHVRADCFGRPELAIGAKEVARMALVPDGLHRRTLWLVFERREDIESAWADLERMDAAADWLLARLKRAAVLPH